MMSNIKILFPDNVNAKFQEFLGKKDKDELDRKGGFFDISLEIKKALKDIDDKIERLL